jgi:hypothetical protein
MNMKSVLFTIALGLVSSYIFAMYFAPRLEANKEKK